jgi:hypothetical protein
MLAHLSSYDYVYIVLFLVLSTIGVRGVRKYRHSANALGYNISIFVVLLGLSYACYSVPDIFSPGLSVVRTVSTLGDVFLYLSLLVQGRILWEVLLKGKVSFRYVAIPIAVTSIAILTIDYYTYTLVSEGPNVVGHGVLSASLLKGTLLLALVLPIGYYFVRSSFMQTDLHSRLKAFVIGLTYLIPGSLQAYNDYVNQGNDTNLSIAIDLGVFVLLTLVMLPRPRRTK